MESKSLNELRDEATRTAVEHGFKDASIGEDIALMHSELSEALEDHRHGEAPNSLWYEDAKKTRHDSMYSSGSPPEGRFPLARKPCGIPSEMADVIIRILHFSGKHGIDIERAVREKMRFNESRPFKHGGKAL